jgi:hypothetical protein
MEDRSRIFLLAMAALFASQAALAFVPMLSFPVAPRSQTSAVETDSYHAPYQCRHLTTVLRVKGDHLRDATGIRPSLHPTTINVIAEALKARARKVDGMAFRPSSTVQPLDVALTAGTIASTAITKRQEASEEDGMKLTEKEEQTIAGRVIGVVMRLDDLEETLYKRVSGVEWVKKYNEWSTFGVLKSEENEKDLEDRIKDDPLFAVSRAECLLAIFLATVEAPQLEKVGEEVPDGSKIDFLDSDRMEVLAL